MYNSTMLGIRPVGCDETGKTPKTPEVITTVISMGDPFKEFIRAGAGAGAAPAGPRLANSPPSAKSPPSVQHTKTQLIKEGLKLTIQSKRRHIPEIIPSVTTEHSRIRTISEEVSQDSQDFSGDGLTPEDQERRRRRRERNKIAASKCREKKREMTVHLVEESRHLESQNIELKSQIQALERQKNDLVDLLQIHRPCVKMMNDAPEPFLTQDHQYQARLSSTPDHSCHSYPSTSSSTMSTLSSSSSYHHHQKVISSCEVYRSTSFEAMYHRQPEARFCRNNGASTSYSYKETRVSDPSLMLSYCSPSTSKCVDQSTDNYSVHGRSSDSPAIYTNLSGLSPIAGTSYVSSLDSPTSSTYTLPSSISVTTSSSDYETEHQDSPGVPPPSYHHFIEKDNSSVYASGFPTGSILT